MGTGLSDSGTGLSLSGFGTANHTSGFGSSQTLGLGTNQASGFNLGGATCTDSSIFKYKNMANYTDRLETFERYPIKPYHPRPSELAALGFYYLGIADKVKCFSCNSCVCNWESTDLVLNEHYRWALGHCPYLNYINNFRK